jgi:hypothetical protein
MYVSSKGARDIVNDDDDDDDDWLGYDPSERSWEPAGNPRNAKTKVNEFHNLYPDKP